MERSVTTDRPHAGTVLKGKEDRPGESRGTMNRQARSEKHPGVAVGARTTDLATRDPEYFGNVATPN